MLQTLESLPETNLLGVETQQWGITAELLPSLATHHILALGISDVGPGYQMGVHRPAYSHINVCLEGLGRVWSNDHWIDYPAGTAGLFPRAHPHGSIWAGQKWRMCWVVYDEPAGKKPIFPGPLSRFLEADPQPIEWLLQGLYREFNGAKDPRVLLGYIELLHLQIKRIAQPERQPSRLTHLWETVDADLAQPWTARDLAALAHTSEAHLRRLTQSELGRSPLQHLAWLRISRAAYLLESHAQTVEAVAWAVGYQSTSAFTTAFKQWLGRSPRQKTLAMGKSPSPPTH